MIKTKILQDWCEPNFKIIAFKEYTQRAQARFQNLLDSMSECISNIEEDKEYSVEEIDSLVSQTMSKFNIKDTMMAVPEGFTNVSSVMKNIVNEVIQEDISSIHEYPVYNRFGDLVSAGSSSAQDIADMLRASLHSTTSVIASCEAYTKSAKEGVEAMTADFNANVMTIFKDVEDDISSTSGYLKSILRKAPNPQDFISVIMQVSGVNDVASDRDQDPTEYTALDNDMSRYTGSSPCAVYDFSSIQNAVDSTVQVAMKAVKGITDMLVQGTNSLFGWIGKKTNEIFSDPYDIKINNKDGYNSIDGFTAQWKDPDSVLKVYHSVVNHEGEITANNVLDSMNSKIGNWLSFKFLFGELIVRFDGISYQEPQYSFDNVCFQFKPYVLNYPLIKPILMGSKVVITTGQSGSITSLINDFVRQSAKEFLKLGSSLYDLPSSEKDAIRGLATSWLLFRAIFALSVVSNVDSIDSSLFPDVTQAVYEIPLLADEDVLNIPTSFNVTNIDFIELCSGYSKSKGAFTFSDNRLDYSNIFSQSLFENMIGHVLSMFCLVEGYSKAHPDKELPFLPYSNDSTSWYDSKLSIKTDDENNQAFSVAIATIVVVALTVAIGVTLGVKVKKFTKQLNINRQRDILMAENKMRFGIPLTNKEEKRYIRTKRKLSTSGFFSSGLSGTKDTKQDPPDTQNIQDTMITTFKRFTTN